MSLFSLLPRRSIDDKVVKIISFKIAEKIDQSEEVEIENFQQLQFFLENNRIQEPVSLLTLKNFHKIYYLDNPLSVFYTYKVNTLFIINFFLENLIKKGILSLSKLTFLGE